MFKRLLWVAPCVASFFTLVPAAHAAPTRLYGNNATNGTPYIYVLDATTKAVVDTLTNLSGSNGRGVVVVGDTLYYTTATTPSVYSYTLSTHTNNGVLFTVPGATALSTIAYDGTNFYVGDYSGTNKVYLYTRTGTLLRTLTLVNCGGNCDGLEYFVQGGVGKLIENRGDLTGPYDIYDLNGNLLVAAFITPTFSPTGIAYDGTNFLVSDINGGKIATYNGTTGAFISSQPITGFPAGFAPSVEDLSADYALVLSSITKTFNPSSIASGGTSLVTLTLMNPSATNLTGGAFTDNLVGMSAAGGTVGGTCGGTAPATLAAGATALSFTGITIPAGGCTVTFSVTSTTVGVNNNQTSGVTTTQNPTAGAPSNIATLTVTVPLLPLVISKAFSPNQIVPGTPTTLTLTITNPNGTPATGVNVADTLPAGVTILPAAGTNTCGGLASATGGVVSLTGGTIAANNFCTLSVTVTSTEGIMVNTTGSVFSNFPTGGPATTTLTAASRPTLTKSFNEVSIGPLNTVALTFTLRNPNTTLPLTNLTFTDVLPAGLLDSNPSLVNGTCGGGNILAPAGTNTITVNTATLAAGASCTFTVNVTATAAALGLLTNTTSTVTSTQALPGDPATAVIFIGSPFQISYVANLPSGDSFIDITNTGTLGAGLPSGTTAATTGAICANVYAFTPDEQLVSCCSCPVTPNGLVSLSAQADLASNTLTPAVPTSLVIKVLATVPAAASCTNSAAAVGTEALANGLRSFSTTIHAGQGAAPPVTGNGFQVTEVPFSRATLSQGELTRIGSLCNFIIANGSGFGVCRSCRLGGLGAGRQ